MAALLALGGAARAQQPSQASDGSRARCDSVLRASVVDSDRVTVRGIITRLGGAALSRLAAGLVMQEFANRFRPPRPLALPVFSPGPVQTRSLIVLRTEPGGLRHPWLDAAYRLEMRRDGTATRIATFRPSLAPGLDSAVIAALEAVSRDKLYPYFPDELADDSIPLELRLTIDREERGVAFPVFASMFPRLPVVDARLREPVPVPRYPDDEREAAVEGDVLFQLVVDVSGEPVLETTDVMHASTRGFALAAFDAVQQMHWTPAHVDGCNVPQVVNVPMHFTLPHPTTDTATTPKPH